MIVPEFNRADLYRMEADYGAVGYKVAGIVAREIEVAGVKMVGVARGIARGNVNAGHARHYPSSITHDVTVHPTGFSVEVGPEFARKQGGLGQVLEFGSANNPPYPTLFPALTRETIPFARRVADGAAKAVS